MDGATNPTSCDVFSSACMACASTLESDSAACAIDPQACTEMQNVDITIGCFQMEGQCQQAALNKAALCHQDCCDVEQANVEICTGDCFVTRASCHVMLTRELDTCVTACNDEVTCAICNARASNQADQCNADAQRCANICVMTHRKS